MTKPYMQALREALGDPKLNKVIEILQEEDIEDFEEFEEEYEPDGAEESRSIDRANARAINRRYD